MNNKLTTEQLHQILDSNGAIAPVWWNLTELDKYEECQNWTDEEKHQFFSRITISLMDRMIKAGNELIETALEQQN